MTNKQVSFEKFKKLLRKGSFCVESDFYSEFERAILLYGRIAKTRIELKITDIKDVIFQFE